MKPADAPPVQSPQAEAAPSNAGAEPFGKGFVADAWYFVALGRDVAPAGLKRYEIMGEPVLIGRTRAGDLYAMRDICPHRAAPLSAGKLVERPGEGETIECPYHGWRFRPDGVCAAIPSLIEDQAFEASRIRVHSFPVRESQGMVFVWMASDARNPTAPDNEPPVFPGVVGGARWIETTEFDGPIDHAVAMTDPADGPSRHRRLYQLLGAAPATETARRLPGFHWDHRRIGEKQVLALICLTPISETRTRITRILWSDHWAFGLAGLFMSRGVTAASSPRR